MHGRRLIRAHDLTHLHTHILLALAPHLRTQALSQRVVKMEWPLPPLNYTLQWLTKG